jgi:hypothetical protein
MCIACELGFWSMIDALPAEARERILREQKEAARFACEAPPDSNGEPPPREGERKP